MSNKVNSNQEYFRVILDLETTGVGIHLPPIEYVRETGLRKLMSHEHLVKSFSHIDISQIGYAKDYEKAYHTSIVLNSKSRLPKTSILENSFRRKMTVKVSGTEIQANGMLVSSTTMQDIANIVFKEGARGTDAYKKAAISRSKPKVDQYYEIFTKDDRRILASKTSLNMLENYGELESAQDIITGNTKIAKNLTKAHNVTYSAVQQNILEGKGSGSLYKLIEDLYLSQIRDGKKVVFQGWNPYFDLEVLRGILRKLGYVDMLSEIDRAYYSGMLQVSGSEKLWKAITYKLSKENPEMAKNFLIHANAEAIAETGRVGRVAKTFKEWEHAVPWSADVAGKLLSYSKAVRSSMPEGYEIHAAGADVNLERSVTDELLNIFKAYKNEVNKDGIRIHSIEDFVEFNAKDPKLLSKILNNRIKAEATKIVGESTIKTITDFNRGLSEAALKGNKYLRDYGTEIIAKGIAETSKAKLYRYGGISAIVSAIMYGTYGLISDNETDPFKSNLSKNTIFGERKPFSNFKSQFEHDPNKTYQTLTALGYGVAVPMLTLYGIGLHQAYTKPKLFGRRLKIPKNFTEGMNEFLKTIRFGIKFIESSVPTTRVFRLSSMFNILLGHTNLKYEEDATDPFKRAIKLTTYEHEKARNFKDVGTIKKEKFFRQYNKYGTFYDSFLDKAKNDLPQDQYAILEEMFKPKDIAKENKVIVKIANTKKGAIVYAEELGIDGIKVKGSDFNNRINQVRLSFKVDDLWLRELNIKNIDSDFRHSIENKYINDPRLHGVMQTELYNRGYVRKYSMDEYLLRKGIPEHKLGGMSPKTLWTKAKYWLELDKKAVGEYGNEFFEDMSKYNRNIKRIISPRGFNNIKGIFSELSIRGMNTFMESPLSLIGMTPEHLIDISKSLTKSQYFPMRLLGKSTKWLSRTHLGLIDYDLGRFAFPKYLFKFATKRILPAWAAWQAFRVTDHMLGAMTFSHGAGPITTAAIKAYEWSTLAYSKLSDITGLTYLNKKQEKVAPGSTGMGFFVPALSAVSVWKTGEIFYKYGTNRFRRRINNIASKIKERPFIKRAMAEEVYKGALNKTALERYFGWALKNPNKAIFSFMMLPMLPFIPGALGSNKSYKERKAEYEGKKEVPVRKYRGWLLSSSPYEGGRPTHFRRHMANLIQSDWENRGVIWPSYFARAAHNLTGGLYGRYMLEEYHAKDQPVYQSAPYGANVPLVGPIISSTIGRIIKPTRTYNELEQGDQNSGISPYSRVSGGMIGDHSQLSDQQIINTIGVTSEGSTLRLYNKMANQFRDLIGFRGFAYETARNELSGRASSEEFTPYAQDATEMYNPAQSMWQYQLGDITIVGGEFLRRLFVYPEKIWRVNNIPNELYGTSWIPQTGETNDFKKYGKDLTHGTTFDKVPMGWLYGSRKGWEFLYPTVKGTELENYPDPIRLEILQSIAPYSNEFNQEAQKVMDMAIGNQLSPYQEQRYYETLDQVRQMKDQIYAHESEYAYRVSTHATQGVLTSVRADGGFTLDAYGSKQFKLAGVSLAEEDIRHTLLEKQKYDNVSQLEKDVKRVQENTNAIIANYMKVGSNLDIKIADFDQMVDAGHGTEAIVGDLNERLIEAGAAQANTGNIAKYNMQQDRVGFGGTAMARYWDFLVPDESFWSTKLINKKDYLQNYLYNQVFNREVKLWNRPIEHILKPMLATALHRFLGIDMIPSFTTERRKDQEYWDVIKYIKYKMLSEQAEDSGDDELAAHYNNLWKSTMLGADPTDDNIRDELSALPQNERAYFSRFSNEPDPKKRGKIYKYLPASAKRLYKSIWMKKEAQASNDPKLLKEFTRLQESEGWEVTDEEYKKWLKDTNGNVSLGDYVRGMYVSEYAKTHAIPDSTWMGWAEDIDIDDVELLSLKEGGRNIEDYGYFENKARVAAYNGPAYTAALDINSVNSTSANTIGSIMPYLMASNRMSYAHGMPTSSISPIVKNNVQTDQHDRVVKQNNYIPLAAADDLLGVLIKGL